MRVLLLQLNLSHPRSTCILGREVCLAWSGVCKRKKEPLWQAKPNELFAVVCSPIAEGDLRSKSLGENCGNTTKNPH